MIKLSVIIPSYKDLLLVKTIGSLLESSELGDRLEIVVVLDGYWPTFELPEDRRVRYIHLGRNVGMRKAINTCIKISRGEFIQRTDEHCMFGPGYDRILTETCEPNWIVTARRYFLDPVKWDVMNNIPVDYERLVIQDGRKFTGQPWRSRTKERAHVMIDETMAMQGSMWVMPRAWWDSVIGELQTDGYGPHYQDSHEMVFKTWQAGGRLMVNKNTWFAHRHRSFPRTHLEGSPENPANRRACWAYSLNQWRSYYENEVRPRWAI